MKFTISILLIFFQLTLVGQKNPVAESVNSFAVDLTAFLNHESDYLISPLSISSSLTMAYLGSDGVTKKKMENVLHLIDSPDFLEGFSALNESFKNSQTNTKVLIANRLWPGVGVITLEKTFKKDNQKYFGTSIEAVNYGNPVEASSIINQWVSDNTENKINDLINPDGIAPDQVMFLINAVYFKSSWEKPFDSSLTDKGNFTNYQNNLIEVNYMNSKGFYKVYEDEFVDVLDLPYSNKEFSFVVLLPKYSMEELEDHFTNQNLFYWTHGARRTQINHLQIPKFKVEFKRELSKDLSDMGMSTAFDFSADFNKMGQANGNIMLNVVLHQTFMDFNEEGTEAAAATATGAVARSMPPKPRDFIVDRPFMYLIRHNETGAILFLGKCSNPEE